MRLIFPAALLLFAANAAFSQDERRLVSPDGQVEFRIQVAPPPSAAPTALNQLAYQVRFHGKPLIDTSFLGLDILYQPLLGAKLGLLTSRTSKAEHYQSLVAEYMQDGSTGRLITVEVRAYNDGVAFRYVVPKSNPLEDLRIEDEETQFRLAPGALVPAETPIRVPFVANEPGVGWLAIQEVPKAGYGRMSLMRVEGASLISRLAKNGGTPNLAFDGMTPFTGPWRVILIGSSRSQALESKILNSLVEH
jgi:alpha-glucosidase